MGRRLYRRRADMMVFGTIGLIIVGVIGVYVQLQEQGEREAASSNAVTPATERLVVFAVSDSSAAIALERDALMDAVPFFAEALGDAQRTGSGVVTDPTLIDTVWFYLAEQHGHPDRSPVIVSYEGESYRVSLTF